jgi:hypothetical protein
MAIHCFRIHTDHFRAHAEGRKRFEIRRNDRGFSNGDYLVLREWNPELECFMGPSMIRRVTCITEGFGLMPGHVALGTTETIGRQTADRIRQAIAQRKEGIERPFNGSISDW